MTTEVITQALTAGQKAFLGQGFTWYLKTAPTAIDITLVKKGTGASVRKFISIPAGFKYRADRVLGNQGWDIMEIVSSVNQTIEMVLSDDDIDASNAITIIGTVNVQTAPFSTSINSAAQAVIAAGNKVSIPAGTRKKLEISNLSSSASSVFVQTPGAGTTKGIEVQPGMSWAENISLAVDVWTDGGATVQYNEYT